MLPSLGKSCCRFRTSNAAVLEPVMPPPLSVSDDGVSLSLPMYALRLLVKSVCNQ